MGRLERRIDALEGIAEEARLRPYRDMARDLDAPVEELLACAAEVEPVVNHLRAEGLSLDAILVRCAETWGLPLDELRRNCEKFGERYST